MHILVVDESRVFLESISEILILENHYPLQAETAVNGLNILRQVNIDLIVSDISIRLEKGLNFGIEVRNLGFNKPIIFLNSEDDRSHEYQAQIKSIANHKLIDKHGKGFYEELLEAVKDLKK